jgi:hypothetical protein
VAVKDDEAMAMMSEARQESKEYWILTLDSVFKYNALADSFRKILKTLEESYDYPIEIEFTVNFTKGKVFKINLLQCRPLQASGLGRKVEIPEQVNSEGLFFKSQGYFLGGNVSLEIKRIIYVDPEKYTKLILSDKHEIARIVGALNRGMKDKQELPTLLMGPGRWGTTTPSLGVPVKFAEINNVTALAEIAFSAGNLMPELSFGTHFFQDLVETGIFYIALFPEKKEVMFDSKWFDRFKNLFSELMPQSSKYKDVVGVYDVSAGGMRIMSDVVSQKVMCFAAQKKASK